ncbi:MAG: polyribonucleotide nucleotidyltransferase [Bacilli bacterium]|jgi:polyribonucleotide nucleotidyltransferase|nr:polyribonucleotide nucleotidyltransferase [Bacilli bacterium]MDD2681489.1 polyribonucleotide nucleotidyltransferase [Bacilli bacterium]MDD3121569.1 polyribonucleotide nucleotidyltransferase [Bacilli bacterium]MDD4062928.1 polyribonucleotide nucleotidyltransferase [Bacilli bacterium]MDD4482286.1 polyribonucleotide nucleotidyltransferase [Bacilli bacterium]
MNEKRTFEYVQGNRKFIIETGEFAKQSNGSVLVRYGDTVVLSVAVYNDSKINTDFFPLTVLYQEKLYAAGKIPGGFLRREGRPSEHETLTSRLIDRPIRPLFPEGFRNEVQVISMVLSSSPDFSAEMAAMLGSSLSLMISDIPFDGPIAGAEVARVDGKLIINPTAEEKLASDISLIVAGTEKAINMVESSANQVNEEDMLEALMFGHDEIKKLVSFQNEIVKEIGKPKVNVELYKIPSDIEKIVFKMAKKDLLAAVVIEEKLARYAKIDKITNKVVDELSKKWENDKDLEDKIKFVKEVCDKIVADEVRRLITDDKVRPDGRKIDEIRPLSSRVSVLPRVHGSAVFTRGQTQALTTVTLGSLAESQIIDDLSIVDSKRFMLQYNFPQFSVGSTGRYGSPGRREIGHGALGEKAIMSVIPSEDDFPYTIRVVSEILESNGSSSQASICAGIMALMDAGVPIKAPVAGIAMGLVSDNDKYTILTDIQGLEDHFGDMDFKVAGTKDGITALQMDIKIAGINKQILKEALDQAKKGRLAILNHMLKTIPNFREELSEYAPKVEMIKINPEKIKDVIGSGGKIINDIISQCNDVKIDIEQDGRIFIMHSSYEWLRKAKTLIEDIVREVEVGKIYTGKVVNIIDIGAFVQLWPSCEGLVHISKIAKERINKVTDVLAVGDEIAVKVLSVDERGRINLSRKDALSPTLDEKGK